MTYIVPFGVSGQLHLKPGNYGGSYTFTQPLTLDAWGNGVATIGQ
jgi:hypothetical protein